MSNTLSLTISKEYFKQKFNTKQHNIFQHSINTRNLHEIIEDEFDSNSQTHKQ